MHPDPKIAPVAEESLARRHEGRNPKVFPIFASAGLVIGLLASGLIVSLLLIQRWVQSRPIDPGSQAVIAPDSKPLLRFPPPNLEVNPRQELQALRLREDAELNQYAWIDRSNGVVRIPIERAMELMARRGLGSTSPGAAAGASGQKLTKPAVRSP